MVYILEMASGTECPDEALDYRDPAAATAGKSPVQEDLCAVPRLALAEPEPAAVTQRHAEVHRAALLRVLED